MVSKKRGRPLKLGVKLDKQVQAYIKTYSVSGAVVNTAIVMERGMGIVSAYDSNLLKENGSHINGPEICYGVWDMLIGGLIRK